MRIIESLWMSGGWVGDHTCAVQFINFVFFFYFQLMKMQYGCDKCVNDHRRTSLTSTLAIPTQF